MDQLTSIVSKLDTNTKKLEELLKSKYVGKATINKLSKQLIFKGPRGGLFYIIQYRGNLTKRYIKPNLLKN